MELPIFYNYQNVGNSVIQPSTAHVRGTALHRFFSRYLLQDAISVYRWGLPNIWRNYTNYFKYCIYVNGYVSVIETDVYGVIPQVCTLTGYDVCMQPTHVVICNPLIRNTLMPRIGKQCVLFKLMPDYGSILDIVNYYADMMCLTAQAAGINLLNTRVAFVFGCSNKSGSDTMKKMYDNISSGEPAQFLDKNMFREDGSPNWQLFQNDVKSTYIADSLLIDLQKWVNLFRTEIGLPNANTEKKERMIVDEVNANNVATGSKVDMWLEELQKSCEDCKNMFGLDISVDWRVNPFENSVEDTEETEVGFES